MIGSANARRINVMNAPLTALAAPGNLAAAMRAIGRDARSAAYALALAPAARKNAALAGMANAIRHARSAILDANAEDVAEAKSGGATAAFLDRLSLDVHRVEAMAAGVEVIRKLKDPVGTVMASSRRPSADRPSTGRRDDGIDPASRALPVHYRSRRGPA